MPAIASSAWRRTRTRRADGPFRESIWRRWRNTHTVWQASGYTTCTLIRIGPPSVSRDPQPMSRTGWAPTGHEERRLPAAPATTGRGPGRPETRTPARGQGGNDLVPGPEPDSLDARVRLQADVEAAIAALRAYSDRAASGTPPSVHDTTVLARTIAALMQRLAEALGSLAPEGDEARMLLTRYHDLHLMRRAVFAPFRDRAGYLARIARADSRTLREGDLA